MPHCVGSQLDAATHNSSGSDHGTNFVGANRELNVFLSHQITQDAISEFCSTQSIRWKYIPERSPHFGGIWESAVKSVKNHLKRVVSPVKLTFEELSTILIQVEACLNSRPLVPINSPDDDGIEVLTPGHFLIGKPITALPDPHKSMSVLCRWHLCQCLVRPFWQRWQNEYLSSINYNKWKHPSRNVAPGDVVVMQESGIAPTKWPLGRVLETHPGQDNLVRFSAEVITFIPGMVQMPGLEANSENFHHTNLYTTGTILHL